jgi:CSLREA domain-containing protein
MDRFGAMSRLKRGVGAARRRLTLVLALAALGLALSPGAANAATITVGPTDDAAPGSFDDTGCTLRDAVQAANTNAAFSDCPGDNAGADTIILRSGQTYGLSRHGVDNTNGVGDLDVTGQTTIRTDGPGLATIDAQNNITPPPANVDRAIEVRPSAGAVTLERLRIRNGFVTADVGGGGILNAAPLTVTNSEITFNQVQGTGVTLGAGIYTRGALGTLTMTGSTVDGNRGEAVGNSNPETVGGGIAVYDSSPAVTITNSTVSGNVVIGSDGANGGPGVAAGIFAGDSGNHPVANLTNVTITNNQAANPGGSTVGGIEIWAGTMTGNLIAGNSDPGGTAPDCFGGATSGGGNVIGSAGSLVSPCPFNGPRDLVGTNAAPINPNLGTLLDNGGPTRTHLPNPGSPAIDRGGSCPATDQRGFLRAAVAPCDAGAVEVGATGSPEAMAASQLKAKLKIKRKVKVKKGPHGRFLVLTGIDASCPTAAVKCTGSASVKLAGGSKRLAVASKRPKKLGKTKLSVDAGKTKAVKVTLTKKASKALRSAGKLKVKISAKLSTLGGKPTVVSRKAKLKPPR